ncbi:nitric oxide synthase [Candidatus Bathyarchaeota archaeon A05DMB-2]|jgi:menaquinone-dependent protoporphyrinogen oxidase|nr:nitric oxide synthase [Candidatus Bathyarchaeota archaeon A05DMB-2]
MKALVVYGTRWGGTVGIAEKIGEALQKSGYAVDVVDAKANVPKVDTYDLVIVGSGVRADKWTKETLRFLEKNATALRNKKTALFVSCQMADREDEAREKAKQAYLWSVADQYGLRPISYGFFGGFLDFSRSHGLLVDIIIRVNRRNLLKNGLDTSKIYDTRCWSSIEAWGRHVAEKAAETQLREP